MAVQDWGPGGFAGRDWTQGARHAITCNGGTLRLEFHRVPRRVGRCNPSRFAHVEMLAPEDLMLTLELGQGARGLAPGAAAVHLSRALEERICEAESPKVSGGQGLGGQDLERFSRRVSTVFFAVFQSTRSIHLSDHVSNLLCIPGREGVAPAHRRGDGD